MATANAATFDGVNDYLTRGADLTGNADSKQLAFSIWLKRTGIGSTQRIYDNANAFGTITFQVGDTLDILFENAAGTRILDINTSAITDTADWHNVLGSVDLADVNKRHLYVDDVSDLTVVTYTDGTMDFTRSDHSIAALPNGTAPYDGCLSIIWINFGQYIDFSVVANRRNFITADGKVPSALANSMDGNIGGLGQPIMFFNSAFGDYQNNLGSGGGFTENGALTDCIGPAIAAADDASILYRRRDGY